MPTVEGQSIAIPSNATNIILTLVGKVVGWPGSCNTASGSLVDESRTLSPAVPGTTYTIQNLGSHQTCWVSYQGKKGDILSVSPFFAGSTSGGGQAQWYSYKLVATYDIQIIGYDCINGACTAASTYLTPGIYQSLEECQSVCPPAGCNPPNICTPPDYCPPGMVCIPSSEWGQIEGLASSVKNASC